MRLRGFICKETNCKCGFGASGHLSQKEFIIFGRMSNQINKKINLLLVAGVIAVMGYLFYNDIYNKPKELKENGILLTAYTKEWQLSTKAGYGLKYEFFYKGGKNTGYAAAH